ncbi:SixA phosphatase family protein [Microbacterium sp.]|uniref:SixA phosphatase family protein n=1 Tax=Microbacterium sp. TaxID=51671 RepID=UPI002D765889|nr:histidine phosphatase family protein [Microbacterium sp.]HET6301838.1 histidine phosphatase family protein [Microbacterium sp.]
MISLALVRHAKSDWSTVKRPDGRLVADHDRPLNDRGGRDAPRMAQRLADAGFRADVVLSSTALRARTTAEAFADALGAPLSLEDELYGASSKTLWAVASAAGHPRVLVVAHDPGMSALAADLSRDRIEHMPTCAVATFTWDTDDWDVADSLEPVDWTYDTPR